MKHLPLKVGLAGAMIAGMLLPAGPASALIACSKSDCWYAADRVEFPGIAITYRPDADLDKVKADSRITWHEKDNLHNWLSGYWLFGNWYEASPLPASAKTTKRQP